VTNQKMVSLRGGEGRKNKFPVAGHAHRIYRGWRVDRSWKLNEMLLGRLRP